MKIILFIIRYKLQYQLDLKVKNLLSKEKDQYDFSRGRLLTVSGLLFGVNAVLRDF